jgi:hypothetical protein
LISEPIAQNNKTMLIKVIKNNIKIYKNI